MRLKKCSHVISITCLSIMALILPGQIGIVDASAEKGSVRRQSATRASERIPWQVISSGGTDGQSIIYALKGTVAQTATGHSITVQYAVDHGYWQPSVADTSCCGRYTGGYTGNTDCDTQGKYTLNDVTVLIDNVFITHKELCCEENGNVDGSADGKHTLNDITRLIDKVFITHAATASCL